MPKRNETDGYQPPAFANPTSKAKVVYLSIPYTHENPNIRQRRYEFVTRYMGIQMDKHFAPFSPVTHNYEVQEKGYTKETWDYWQRQYEPFLEMADEMHVIEARGVEESTGVNAEVEIFDGPIKSVDPLGTQAIQLVGISGKKRSGKDLLGRKLQQELGYEPYSFARPIKEACKEIFLMTENQVDGDRKEEEDPYWGFTPRFAMQHFGTDAFREEFGDDVWIKNLQERLRLWLPKKAVITDVRFPNEVEMIQRFGGRVIRIDASERLDQDDDHSSETALDDYDGFDCVIENNGTLQEFESRIDAFIQARGTFGDL